MVIVILTAISHLPNICSSKCIFTSLLHDAGRRYYYYAIPYVHICDGGCPLCTHCARGLRISIHAPCSFSLPLVSIFYATAPSTAAMISAAAYSAVSPKRDGLRAYALRASLSRSLSKNTGTELKPLAADCLTCAHSTRNRLHWKRRYSSNTMITGTTTNWYTFLSLKTENGVRVSVQVNRRNRFVNIA